MGAFLAALICLATCGGAVVAGALLHHPKTENHTQVSDSASATTVKLSVTGPRKCCVPSVKETLSSCPGVKSVNYKRRVYILQTDSTFNLDDAIQRVFEQGKKHNENFYHQGKYGFKPRPDWIVTINNEKK